MPPLRMTNVIPIARIALIATCLTRIERLPVVRNSGDSRRRRASRPPSAMNARSRRTSRAATTGATQPSAATPRAPGVADAADASASSVISAPARSGGDPAARHHDDARVAAACDLRQLGRGEHDAPGRRRPGAASVSRISAFAPTSTPRVGSSISSTRGRVITLRAITTFCWLPPLSAPIGAPAPAS